jgi:uncharacterized protein involved in outer membrane biogenesis
LEGKGMSRRVRILLWLGGSVLVLGILALLLVPMLVDVNRYRDLIEGKAEEALGREVDLGPMKLSLLPSIAIRIQDVRIGALPGEGRDDLLTVRALRVGARLMPLLASKLEVTSVVVEGPSLSLARGADGAWNVQQLVASPDQEPAPTAAPAQGGQAPPEFSVDRLRITGGTIRVRDAYSSPERPLELTLADLDLSLEDVALDRVMGMKLSAGLSLADGSRLRLDGRAGPLARSEGEPMQLEGSLDLEGLPPAELVPWLEALGGVHPPEGMLGERPLTAQVAFEATFVDGEGGTSLQRAAVHTLRLDGVDLTLRRSADGVWNFAGTPEGAAGPEPTDAVVAPAPEISLAGVAIENARIRLVDASGAQPLEVVLDPLSLSLDRLPLDGAAQVRLTAPIELPGGSGALSLTGSVGPLREGEFMALDVSVELEDIALAAAAPLLADYVELGGDGTLQLTLQVKGEPPSEFDVAGTLQLSDVDVQVPGVDGAARRASVNLTIDADVGISGGGDALELRRTDLSLAGNEVRVRGRIDRSGDLRQVDLTLLPARLPVDDLNELLSLAGLELPFTLSSSEPLELEAKVRGAMGGEAMPEVDAKLQVRDLSLRYAGLEQPLEGVSASVTVTGETVQVDRLAARIGASDLAGTVTLHGYDASQVRFDLVSQQADFGELLSLVSGDETAEPTSTSAPSETADSGDAAPMDVQGTLRIERGSFDTLQFQKMEAGLKLLGDDLTLDPFQMQLYQGTFEGSATVDLGAEPPSFQLQSDVASLNVDTLLTEVLDAGGLVDGRFSGVLEARGAGLDYDSVVSSLSGGGKVEVSQGSVGKLDVLSVLSKATGVFGEDTLNALSRKLEQEGTAFETLSATLRLADGAMRSSDVTLRSPDLNMDGEATVNLLQATLQGKFQVKFSDALSRSMKEEGSRASQVFWDTKTKLVTLPLGLSGSFEAPTPSIDWGTAVKQATAGRVEDELRGRLGGILGDDKDDKKDEEKQERRRQRQEAAAAAQVEAQIEAPAKESALPPPQDAQAQEAAPAPAAPASSTVGVRIGSASWGGSLLKQDLEIEGKVRGENIARGVLVVTDASGRELVREDLKEIPRYFRRSGADPTERATIEWEVTVDADELAGAKSPFTVRVEVFDTSGGSAVATEQVSR